MWQYWMRCYPAHAYDIERELSRSKREKRDAWWNLKNRHRMVIKESRGKRSRPDDAIEPLPARPKKAKKCLTFTREKGHFELTYLDPPCRICGSDEHPALEEREDDYCEISYQYICPIAEIEDWETTCMRPCPVKLAAYCKYDESVVLKEWHQMISNGWGQHQTSRVLGRFLNIATKKCREKVG